MNLSLLCSAARAAAVAVTKALLAAFMVILTQNGSNLQLDQLLQALAHQFGDQLPRRLSRIDPRAALYRRS